MPDLTSYEVESLRRSVAMLPANAPSGLDRETVLRLLAQLESLLEEREHSGG